MRSDRMYQVIMEEMTKPEVTSLIQSKISDTLSSKDFEKQIRKITGEIINDLFKTLYQHNNIWKNAIK